MIFVINSGSSSLKFKLYGKDFRVLLSGIVERIGLKQPYLSYELGSTKQKDEFASVPDHAAALKRVFDVMVRGKLDLKEIAVVGHRVVHGGEEFTAPTVITKANLAKLEKYSKLAPLHNPPNLAGIRSCMKLLPKAKNVAVFDTAFYKTIPAYAYLYSLPWEYYTKHKIRKYGFHGISHRYVSEQAAKLLKKPLSKSRLITCHLGSGASVTAILHGKAIDTSMGFTPLEGLTMSTRCGDIDAAIPLYLIREMGMTPDQVDDALNKQSGLLGISGYKDLRDVMAAAGIRIPGYVLKGKVSAEKRKRAGLAIDIFAYDVARYIAQFAGLMGGVDAVVFTAGIGERSEFIRKAVMAMVPLPGKFKVLVVPTDEEGMIARDAATTARK
jgi:acetate kinase